MRNREMSFAPSNDFDDIFCVLYLMISFCQRENPENLSCAWNVNLLFSRSLQRVETTFMVPCMLLHYYLTFRQFHQIKNIL